MAINLFNTSSIMDRGQQAFEDTNANIQGMMNRYTNARAGRAYASGDRQGAARMLAQGGNLDGARVLENDIQGDARQKMVDARQAMQDTQAAETLKYTRGREAATEAVSKGEMLVKALNLLPDVSTPAERRQALSHPIWGMFGITPEAVAQLNDNDLSDAAAKAFKTKIKMQIYNVRNVGLVGFDPNTNKSKVVQAAPVIYGNNQNVDIYDEGGDEGGDEGEDGLAGGFTNDTLGAPPAQVEPQSVMSGFSGQNTISGGSGQDAIPGYRRLRSARAPQGRAPKDQWDDLPGGGQINRATGKKENVPVSGSQSEFASLRKEFNGLDEVSKFKDTAASYNQVRTLSSRPKPTSTDDIALIFSFMKMLDPGSVVREGEFALVGQAAGVPDRVLMQISAAKVGKGLTPSIRARLSETAAEILLTRRAAYDVQSANYRQIAKDIGARPDLLAEDPTKWRGRIKPPAARLAPDATPAARPALSDIFDKK
jgi:hypothetical protein